MQLMSASFKLLITQKNKKICLNCEGFDFNIPFLYNTRWPDVECPKESIDIYQSIYFACKI